MILAQGINGGINGGRPQHWATREPKSCTTDQYVGQPRAQREAPFEHSLPRAGQQTPPNYITPMHSLLCPVDQWKRGMHQAQEPPGGAQKPPRNRKRGMHQAQEPPSGAQKPPTNHTLGASTGAGPNTGQPESPSRAQQINT